MRRITSLLSIYFFSLNIITLHGQDFQEIVSPVNFRILLSGSFAELRTNHFHSGIDIKTMGRTGKAIRAIDSGYISRIKIQTNGYGKSVYINHPSGYTSVYGHLSDYNDIIDQYVKNYQYKNEIHTLDIYPGKKDLWVQKGQIIGFSGNTGSSSGPHLHFEIRNSSNQHPLNPLKYNLEVKDNVKPVFYSLVKYTITETGKRRRISQRERIEISGTPGNYRIKENDTILLESPVGFGIESYDFTNDSHNKCGLYSLKMYVNDRLHYHFQADEFSFDESRYINSFIDYQQKVREKKNIQLLFRLPNNKLSMYRFIKSEGLIFPESTKADKITVQADDLYGNTTLLSFFVKADEKIVSPEIASRENSTLFKWDQQNEFSSENLSFTLPAMALYEDSHFSCEKLSRQSNVYPFFHNLHTMETPLHKSGVLKISTQDFPSKLMKKALLVYYDEKKHPEAIHNSHFSGNTMTASIRKFGLYSIEPDTIAPEIHLENFYKNKDMKDHKTISFRVKDDLSGLRSYRGFIDGNWVLFEYDPKNNRLFYKFDSQVKKSSMQHKLKISCEDFRNNRSVLVTSFIY